MLYVRPPVVAGTFYDLEPERLKKQIEAAFKKAKDKKRRKITKFNAAVVPHAGYMYSGWVAAKVYSMLDPKEHVNFIILGPNHYMFGSKYATMNRGLWKTPLGGLSVHGPMANTLLEKCELLENDVLPHQNDHSIEVQLPLLQHLFGNDFKFVPISIMCEVADDALLQDCRIIGKSIADAIKSSDEKWMILASSDFSHYIPQRLAKEVDDYIIKAILRLNEKSFLNRIVEKNASVCGFGGIAAAMVAAKELGSKRGKLLKYATSADVTGDRSAVVGYASIIM